MKPNISCWLTSANRANEVFEVARLVAQENADMPGKMNGAKLRRTVQCQPGFAQLLIVLISVAPERDGGAAALDNVFPRASGSVFTIARARVFRRAAVDRH
jgi:hypothetical protein